MSLRRRARARREGSKANIDMNSLIDLTFLLLVVFIVTLPTLEQTVHIVLPVGKTESQKDDKVFLGEAPTTHEALKASLEQAVAEDPEVNVLIRGDVDAGYGQIYEIVRIAKNCNVKHLGLVSKEN